MCVSVCVCARVCVSVDMYVYVRVYVCEYTCVCVCARVHVHLCVASLVPTQVIVTVTLHSLVRGGAASWAEMYLLQKPPAAGGRTPQDSVVTAPLSA